jgi:nucleoside-diphosphate-sugar epimerase
MKIFVTGSSGFIGRAFCRAAIAAGHDVLGLCRSPTTQLSSGCQMLVGDLAHLPWEEVRRFTPDALLHLAWIVTPGAYLNSPENDTLIGQSEDLFKRAMDFGVRHLAAAGTCIEYAPTEQPLKEHASPLAPAFTYSRAKMATSRMLETVAMEREVLWTWFRIFYCFGEGEHPDRIASWIMRKLAAGESVEVKTPDSVKDYIHVDDVASAMLWCLEKKITGPVNVACGHGIRILDLAQKIAQVVQAEPSLVSGANPPAHDPFPTTVADISRLKDTGWTPRLSLAQGLEHMWQNSNSVR